MSEEPERTEEQRCGTCRFVRRKQGQFEIATCRAGPPSAYMGMVQDKFKQVRPQLMSSYPLVKLMDEGCGMWKPVEPKLIEGETK